MTEAAPSSAAAAPYPLPRVAIQFCTQCKWMLRAAYFAQELLSTFSTSLGEVALQPATGGTFVVTLTHLPDGAAATSTTTLWDRKTDGGFPETKELKRRLRDVIEPNRDLGHVDRNHAKPTSAPAAASEVTAQLKKHPANAGKMNEGDGSEQKSPLGDDARAAVAAAHANTGQKETAEASPPGQGLGELRRQKQEQQQQQAQATSTQAEDKQACEDCA